jgi:isopenicillin-N epimerase
MTHLRSLFYLDPNIIYLNHGSFGACPKPVFEIYQSWQRELEKQPTEFLGRRIQFLMSEAREKLAAFLYTSAEDVVYFPNPTTAINMVARSIRLNEGDQVLTTDHEYGAMDRTWRFIMRQTKAEYKQIPVSIPLGSAEDFIDLFWSHVTERTKVIFISHISSPTSIIFPVDKLCAKARAAGILTIIDGAHAPGHIKLDLTQIGADIYTGALHKWLNAPKGAAFLYASKGIQEKLDPLVVSWGVESDNPSGHQFIDYHEWQGTRDMSAFLSVPAAIQFQMDFDWQIIQNQCHELAAWTISQTNQITRMKSIYPAANDEFGVPFGFGQMASILLPEVDTATLKMALYNQFRIEIPVLRWNNRPLIRVSYQMYNSEQDADRLICALRELI